MTSGAKTEAKNDRLMRNAVMNEVDDVLRGGPREKNPGDTGFLQAGNVGLGNNPAEEDSDIVHALLVQQAHELGAEGVVRAGKDGEADDVDVFLDRGGGDHLRGLAQAGVDDFHAGIA